MSTSNETVQHAEDVSFLDKLKVFVERQKQAAREQNMLEVE